MNWNTEMIEKAKAAASVEELLEIAKANAVELTPAEAATYFAQLNPVTGELSDDDLDAVSGGACSGSSDIVRITSGQTCSKCGGTEAIMQPSIDPSFYTDFMCKKCGWVIGHDDGTIKYEKIG